MSQIPLRLLSFSFPKQIVLLSSTHQWHLSDMTRYPLKLNDNFVEYESSVECTYDNGLNSTAAKVGNIYFVCTSFSMCSSI